MSRPELYRRLPPQPEDHWWAELARASPDRSVLELGAGTGRLTATFLSAGSEVTAVDHDRGMLASLRAAHGHVGLEVIEADVTSLPDGRPAGLVALPASLLNELPDPEARRAALEGAARRCHPEGHVAVHLLSPWWLAGLAGRSVGRLVTDTGSIEVGIEAGAFSPWTGRRRATLTYRFPDGEVLADDLDAAVVTPGELDGAFAAAHLELVAAHGALPPAPVAPGDVSWHLLARPT